ncbi:hypothetical protein Ciccas_008535 [Cichlidogyrus casuarinus]|uniref:Uncharacterized protein n=1 Tax=Cichlidogyrus casuarinus TaxID=1844966 RepID=A0ABD2PZL9_9PLAT
MLLQESIGQAIDTSKCNLRKKRVVVSDEIGLTVIYSGLHSSSRQQTHIQGPNPHEMSIDYLYPVGTVTQGCNWLKAGFVNAEHSNHAGIKFTPQNPGIYNLLIYVNGLLIRSEFAS